jgi:hypothetical protein
VEEVIMTPQDQILAIIWVLSILVGVVLNYVLTRNWPARMRKFNLLIALTIRAMLLGPAFLLAILIMAYVGFVNRMLDSQKRGAWW